jgi:hypothetical protein
MQPSSLYPVAFWALVCMQMIKLWKLWTLFRSLQMYHKSLKYTSVHMCFHIHSAGTMISCDTCILCSCAIFIVVCWSMFTELLPGSGFLQLHGLMLWANPSQYLFEGKMFSTEILEKMKLIFYVQYTFPTNFWDNWTNLALYMLWHVHPLLGNDHEISDYTTAVSK